MANTTHGSGKVIREDMPVGANHTHDWQVLKEDANEMVLVCRCEGCSATKKVPKPRVKESGSKVKPVLMG